MVELLIFIAPAFQIIFSVLRVNRMTTTPLYLIFPATILLGFVLSFTAMKVLVDNMPTTGMRCATPAMAVLFCGIFITLVTSPIISLVFYFINKSINNKTIAIK
jgi:hypothetical protein